MKKYRNEAHEFFSNLTDDEFYNLLADAGFKVRNGSGKVVFTDQKVYQGVVDTHFDDYGCHYHVVRGETLDDEFNSVELEYILSELKGKNVRVTVEVIE